MYNLMVCGGTILIRLFQLAIYYYGYWLFMLKFYRKTFNRDWYSRSRI